MFFTSLTASILAPLSLSFVIALFLSLSHCYQLFLVFGKCGGTPHRLYRGSLTLIYWCGKSKHFFLNLSTFFQFSKRGRESLSLPPTCTPIYHTIKAKKKKKNTSGTVPVTYREKHSEKARPKSLNFFFSALHKKPFTDISQGFWPNMQLEHLLNNYFQEQLFWQNTFSDCFWK